ncbi:MAG TPA: amidohydrolase family protein, partial [Vitreimonas sp.]|nr:amidohydrolase family protein [Vitreimonas sp.]
MHDLVIRGGTVVNGTGAARFVADVAINGGLISAVGDDVGPGKQEIDASGKIVAPGWVDIHTHYDGQATWDQEMAPSSWHGVTTVIMGNCGVGFAPAKPDKHDWLIGLMEGVEDIPGTALAEGMTWNWETFPEYLDELERLPRTVDIGTHVPHGAVRAYVMDERGARNDTPTEHEIGRMSRIVEDGLRAGALGFSTSRTILHRSVEGELVPGTTA